jgi:DNA-binding PadR family transcriptional regulator
MEKILFLLGLIRSAENMYGYQINELIDSHFGVIVNITRPTAYRLLEKMAQDRWISFREEQIGGRPPRKIFSITEDGEQAFQRILRESLESYSPTEYGSPVNMAFLAALPAEDVLTLLEARRDKIRELLQTLDESKMHEAGFELVFEHQRRRFETELALTEDVIEMLAKKEQGNE